MTITITGEGPEAIANVDVMEPRARLIQVESRTPVKVTLIVVGTPVVQERHVLSMIQQRACCHISRGLGTVTLAQLLKNLQSNNYVHTHDHPSL